MPDNQKDSQRKKKGFILSGVGCLVFAVAIIVVLAIAWVVVRSGVFTIQPIGAIPNGITFIYHSRSSDIPFFSSPDGLCLKMQGNVTLLCRMMALAAVANLIDRIIIKLPYNRWAYLQSTGGLEFDK